jgi:transcriptional regulator with GAF, ATPase, and Fis domain
MDKGREDESEHHFHHLSRLHLLYFLIRAICGPMEMTQPLLLDAWREVGRHAGVQATLDALEARIARDLPGAALRVRALDHGRRSLDTLGALGLHPSTLRDQIEPDRWEALLAWARQGELLRGRAEVVRKQLGPIVSEAEKGECVIGPLLEDSTILGLAILTTASKQGLGSPHLKRMRALLEPLAAALSNDQRIHEMDALREAAEADRRSLLSRLGRRDIGEAVVGAEDGLAFVMERVSLVAQSDLPVLLFGETGSGKEVVARALRNRSRRASGPFVRVNCGAIPAGLIDSELFGHERGSFSGATSKRRGWFERADAGTLFLDEVGELPLDAQVRLLRVLQDGSFERVGGEQPVHVDVRVVAATHRDLRRMVDDGRFREDLWYRLAVFPIEIPPLRDRPEDIPALAAHFALRACERFGTRALAPTATDLELLAGYDWPGNVRELAAVLDRAVILGGGDHLDVAKALGTSAGPRDAAPREGNLSARTGTGSEDTSAPLLSLDRAMAKHVEAALERCQGRIEGPDGAAHLLEINPHTLRARMRKLGVDPSRFRDRRAPRREGDSQSHGAVQGRASG